MFNIIEILADGSEQIINAAPYRGESEAWADAHWIALAEPHSSWTMRNSGSSGVSVSVTRGGVVSGNS
jgi:hypothetical protein